MSYTPLKKVTKQVQEKKTSNEQSDFVQALFTTLKQAPSTLQRVDMSLVSIQFRYSEPFGTLNQ